MLMKNKSSFGCLAVIVLAAALLTSCKKNTEGTPDIPSFFTDTTGDKVLNNTIVTYNIYKSKLYPYMLYNPPAGFDASEWAAEQKNKEKHENIFRVFAELIPETFRQGIKYFSIQENAIASMGPHKVNALEPFALTVSPSLPDGQDKIPAFTATENLNNTLGYDLLHYSMIHEFGHYVTMNSSQAESYNVYKPGSFIQGIMDITWDKMTEDEKTCMLDRFDRTGKLNLYPCMPAGEFVTGYAGSNFSEDAAETFAHFVLLDNKPARGTHANDKILLFYKDLEMIKIREAIRDNLKRMNIVPGQPNIPGKSI
jgi:hypothetical protein